MPSKPTTEMSAGTRRPAARRAVMASRASRLLRAKREVTGAPAARRRPAAAWPLSGSHSTVRSIRAGPGAGPAARGGRRRPARRSRGAVPRPRSRRRVRRRRSRRCPTRRCRGCGSGCGRGSGRSGRHVVELVDRRQHPRPGRSNDATVAIDDAGDGLVGDAGPGGDVADGRSFHRRLPLPPPPHGRPAWRLTVPPAAATLPVTWPMTRWPVRQPRERTAGDRATSGGRSCPPASAGDGRRSEGSRR